MNLGPRRTAWPGQRLLDADPLLPVPAAVPGCGAELTVPGPDGQPAAAGICEHWQGTPGSLELAYGAAARFQLTAQAADADALDELVSAWRDHLAGIPGARCEDSAAVIAWPSRDVTGPATLLRRGFASRTVLAARPVSPALAAVKHAGLRVRRAGPADLGTVTRLGLEVIRFDAHFGTVAERPDTAAALRRDAEAALAAGEPWIWLAERGSTPAGLLYARRPDQARWLAPMVRLAPAAYLELMYVQPDERGLGAGPALVGQLHQETAAAGTAVVLLHYDQVNPLAGPFWSRQGYRPLWTIWEVRPASAVR